MELANRLLLFNTKTVRKIKKNSERIPVFRRGEGTASLLTFLPAIFPPVSLPGVEGGTRGGRAGGKGGAGWAVSPTGDADAVGDPEDLDGARSLE